jgi:prevent-host-death family protein
MKISTKAIVSNSDMIKSYKSCREKAEVHGKIFILKNNQPDAVLISAVEYEKLSELIEYIESLDELERTVFIEALPAVLAKKG